MKKLLTLLMLVWSLPLAAPLAGRVQSAASADEWPQWRGPQLNGHSSETSLPLRWSKSDNIAWKVAIPGKGHSSPIIWGDRIFLTTAIEPEQKRMLLCLSRTTGKPLWEKQVLVAPLEQKHSLNNYASATPGAPPEQKHAPNNAASAPPAADGQRVYVAFLDKPNVRLVCYDMDGNELW